MSISSVSVGVMHPATSDSRLQQNNEHKKLVVESQQANNNSSTQSASYSGDMDHNNEATDHHHTIVNSADDAQLNSSKEEKADADVISVVNIVTSGPSDGSPGMTGVGSTTNNDISDSGSVVSLASSSNTDISVSTKTENSEGQKKRKSFFNFRRSKKDHKKEVIL